MRCSLDRDTWTKKRDFFYLEDLRKNVLLISLITCILFGHKVHYVLVGLTQSNPSYQSLNLPQYQLATVNKTSFREDVQSFCE